MSKKIAVLGAGPMGLAVAYQLVKDGYKPVVFEADDRVGGMTATFDFDGLEIERYYHFHCNSDVDFFEVLEELGISEKLKWYETKMGFYYDGRVQEWGNPIALLRFKGLGLVAKIRYGLHAWKAVKRNKWRDLDDVSALDWIKRSVGPQAYDVLWSKLFDYKFYEYSDCISAAWIWSRIRRIGRSRRSLMREKLGVLDGGSKTLLNALTNYIESNGGEIRLGTPVSQVRIRNQTVTGVLAGEELLPYHTVISTIPLPYVPTVFPDLAASTLDQYRALKNVAVVCVIIKLRKPLTENFWLNINDPNMEVPGLVEYSNLTPMSQHVIYVPYYMPAHNPKFSMPDEYFESEVKKYLRKINQSLVEADITAVKVNRYRYAQPICPKRFLEKLPPFDLSVRNLFIADTSHYYPEDRGISESIGFGRMLARKMASRLDVDGG